MRCPVKVCTGAIHRIKDWEANDHCDYVEAICNQCQCLYWLVKRDNKYSFRRREKDEVFDDHRKDKR